MQKKILLFMLAIFIIILIWSGIDPVKRMLWFFEASPAMVLVLGLIITYNRFPLTPLAYCIIFIGSIIMLIGGHYTYGGVPWFDHLKNMFSLSRNYFDRLGHFWQGMIVSVLLREILTRFSIIKVNGWRPIVVLGLSLAFSSAYELFEFLIGISFTDNIHQFLGSQGDPWDSQWDMIWALLGSLTVVFASARWHDRQMKRLPPT